MPLRALARRAAFALAPAALASALSALACTRLDEDSNVSVEPETPRTAPTVPDEEGWRISRPGARNATEPTDRSPSRRAERGAAAPRRTRAGWITLPSLPLPPHALAFDDAKRTLERAIYDAPHRVEIYCGCRYDERKHVDFESCESAHPYVPAIDERERAGRIEWDHVLPASFIGQTFACWSDSSDHGSHREHCREASEGFAEAEGDMHNLLPSVGQLNAIRDNFPFAELEGEDHLANCDFEMRDRLVEPRPEARGAIARSVLYAAATYGVELNPRFYATVVAWHRAYPPSAWERERNDRIERVQGNRNPFVDGRGDLAPPGSGPGPSRGP